MLVLPAIPTIKAKLINSKWSTGCHVPHTSSVGDILQRLNYHSLEYERLVMMFKIVKEDVVITKKENIDSPMGQSRNMHSSSVIVPP